MSATTFKSESLRIANIFDPIEPTLDQRVFKGDKPRVSVVKFIDKVYSKQFERTFGNKDAHEYINLYLTGSLTTFQYSDDSDCDISVFPNYALWDEDPVEVRKQLIAMSIDKIDGTFLPGSRHPLQFFVVPPDVDPTDLYKPGLRSAWSFEAHDWLVPPEKERAHDVQVELPETFRRASEMADKMTQALDADPEIARDMWHQIHKKRQQEQRAGLGDFSEGNIVYKWLLHEGLFDRIRDELHEYIAHYGAQSELRPHAPLQELAKSYMDEAGLPYSPPKNYATVDPTRAARIAQAYEEMIHNPNDPAVKASYDAMISETKAQYDHLVRNGYRFEFYPQDHDPYPDSPHQAVQDIYRNKHLYVYPTASGFGSLTEQTDHPLLEDSGVRWNGLAVTHNDLFRGVHDVFGHAKEGVGFRANGEENAWRQHSAMYSDEARPAMTAETRGQNSWVNFGPHGEANQTANQASTVYADQKAGLLPDWAMHDGLQASSKVVELDTITDPTHVGRRPWIYYEGNTYVGSDGSSHAGLFTSMIENMGADPEELWGRWNNDESGVCGLIDTDDNKIITYGVNPPDRVMADLHSLGLPIYTQYDERITKRAGTTMYHVSPVENRDKITRGGLRGDHEHEDVSSPWDVRPEGRPEGIYLWETINNALKYAQEALYYQNNDIYLIDASGLRIMEDPFFHLEDPAVHDEWRDTHGITGAFISKDDIPPDRIQLYLPDIPPNQELQERYYDSLHLGAEDLMDRVTMKVIYDFEKDRIYLGTQADQKGMPGTTILGDYDDKTSTVTLYHGDGNWLNPNYFHRLWYHSFPNRALHNVRIQSGDDPAVTVQTRNPFSVPKQAAERSWTDYDTAFIYLGAPYNELLMGGSEHYELLQEFVDSLLQQWWEKYMESKHPGPEPESEDEDEWSDYEDRLYDYQSMQESYDYYDKQEIPDYYTEFNKVMEKLMQTKMVYGHIGTERLTMPDGTNKIQKVYVIYSHFLGDTGGENIAQGLKGKALQAIRQRWPEIVPYEGTQRWFGNG